jgi:hypothetical protein
MSIADIPLLTVENYKILPETGPHYQFIEGRPLHDSRPKSLPSGYLAQPRIHLLDYLEKHPIGKLYHAPFDVYLDKYDVFQPDIVVDEPTPNDLD